MADGASRPTICCRESSRRRFEPRHRGCRAGIRRRLHASHCRQQRRDQCDAVRNAKFQLYPGHRSDRKHRPRAPAHAGESIASSSERSRVHRVRQGQSRQSRHGLGRQRFASACHRRIFPTDDGHRSYSCSLSWRGTRGGRADWRGSSGSVHRNGDVARTCQGGTLRALAVTTATRSEVLPDVPTLSEFIPGFEASQWVGLVAPRDTPSTIIEKLNIEIRAALDDPKMKARFTGLGGMVLPGSPAYFFKINPETTEKWGKVIRAANIKPI